MHNVTLVRVGPENLAECGIGCIRNRDNPGYGRKVEWLRKRFAEGLRFLVIRDEREKPLAFLEYVPGEFAWRPVDARGWLGEDCRPGRNGFQWLNHIDDLFIHSIAMRRSWKGSLKTGINLW